MIFAIVKSPIALKSTVTATGEEKVVIKSAIAPNAIIMSLIVIQMKNKFQIKSLKKKLNKINDIHMIFQNTELI
jgi:hypothetical protein